MKKFSIFLIFFLSLFGFFSCSSQEDSDQSIIDLSNHVYWSECTAESTPLQTEYQNFHKFITKGRGNIFKTVGKEQEYIWIKIFFYTPEELKNKALGLFISYLHFADKVWVNGVYVGGSGSFPPDMWSSLWNSHLYTIPAPLIKDEGQNIILIKVYNKGRSGISDNIKLGELETTKRLSQHHDFFQGVIYLYAAGGMLFTAILFLLIFIWRKKEREYLSFSLLCIASLIFTTPFFANHIPIFHQGNISYLLFTKLVLCEAFFLMVFLLSGLIIEFVKQRETKFIRDLRVAVLVFCSVATLSMPTFDSLANLTYLMLILSIFQVLLGLIFVIKAPKDEKEKKDFRDLMLALTPLFVSIPIDFIIKGLFQKVDTPYITLFGWLITVLNFLIIMSIRYNSAVAQNEYLNIKLRREVLKQTKELSKKNQTLEDQLYRSATDLEMASLVQKKFFPYPPRTLRGWDIAVSYNPLDKVSGDMYDYYMQDGSLKGFSLFDVSGHGIAASLVTMLAKNIVFQSFMRNMKKNESVSRTLYEINDEIIEAKGEIENYLTGIMFRFGNFDENEECLVEMANAGHPNPILYSAKSNICDELECPEEEDHHGAIGLDFITVSFPQINFTMAEDDIILFYTDGLSEGRNKDGEMFGKERIKHILKENYAKNAQSIMEELVDAYQSFTKGVKRDDDITVVVMKRENSANYIEELDEV